MIGSKPFSIRSPAPAVVFTEDAVQLLAREGFDPEYGARPLRRTIQRLVENQLSRLVLDGSAEPGDRISVDVLEGELHFDVESGAASIEEGAEAAQTEPAGAR